MGAAMVRATNDAGAPLRIAVVGCGVEGRVAVEYWRERGEVVVHDSSAEVALPPGVATRTGPDYLRGLDEVDLIVRSPGVRPDVLPAGARVTSVVAEFLSRCPAPVVGVTGTKGKGTTATAIASILRAAGRTVHLGGNIGRPPLAFLDEVRADDVVVLELSNMQLMDLRISPRVAVVLAVTPDHQNWHTDLAEYHEAKASIAAYQKPDDVVVYDAGDEVASAIAARSPGARVPFGVGSAAHARADGVYRGDTRLLDAAEVPLRGAHNLANVAAAITAAETLPRLDPGQDDMTHAIIEGVRTLRPLPHRLTLVAQVGGVSWVDDSLSTTPETSIAAMAAYQGPKVLILGGSSKGVPFDALARAIAGAEVRRCLLVGQEAVRIAAALDRVGVSAYEHVTGGMPAVVARAAELARPGDTVLLSPACASFGEFRDYADRGERFAAAVAELRGPTET
jgi:UDP-N-acetylmuramoylalanine--D-glutamate ligase